MRKTKVCYVGPLSIHTHRWMEAFSCRGYDLSIITDCEAWVAPVVAFARVHNIPTLRKNNFPRRFVPNTMKIIKTLKEINPSLVHLHVQHLYSLAIIPSGYPFLLTSWGAEALSLPHTNILTKSIAKIAATKARYVTVDANCLKKLDQNGNPRKQDQSHRSKRPTIPTKNSVALSEKIIQLIKNENTRSHFGERCFQIVKQRASRENWVSKMERIYRSVL